jgi:hypothetical protein
MERNPTVGNILRNGWMQLALLDPDTNQLSVYQRGEFVPYKPESAQLATVSNSLDWYRGRREHLPFAFIQPHEGSHAGTD